MSISKEWLYSFLVATGLCGLAGLVIVFRPAWTVWLYVLVAIGLAICGLTVIIYALIFDW